MKANQVAAGSSVDRAVLVGITAVGMAICSGGIGKVAVAGQWISVQGIGGSLIGLTILGIVGARLMGRQLPFAATDRAVIAAVVVLGLVKAGIALLFPLSA